MGLYLAHQKYNIDPGSFKGDNNVSVQESGNGNYDGIPLENFNPNLAGDPFRWIPKGLMEDLRDNSVEPSSTLVNDQVSGYTVEQIFGALKSDVSSVQSYQSRLLQLYGNTQLSQILKLFISYGY
ncbi:MAG: hypothetical protein JSS70_19750 [Bacteroidetes bacterium]|nr:hypothetical protein [Bacteroidota bacterium]